MCNFIAQVITKLKFLYDSDLFPCPLVGKGSLVGSPGLWGGLTMQENGAYSPDVQVLQSS